MLQKVSILSCREEIEKTYIQLKPVQQIIKNTLNIIGSFGVVSEVFNIKLF